MNGGQETSRPGTNNHRHVVVQKSLLANSEFLPNQTRCNPGPDLLMIVRVGRRRARKWQSLQWRLDMPPEPLISRQVLTTFGEFLHDNSPFFRTQNLSLLILSVSFVVVCPQRKVACLWPESVLLAPFILVHILLPAFNTCAFACRFCFLTCIYLRFSPSPSTLPCLSRPVEG